MVSPALASEDFTGANGTALPTHNANWTECEGSFALSNNAVVCDAFGGSLFAAAGWNGRTFDSDQFSEAVVATTNAAQFIGVTARCDITGPTATFYLFWATTNFFYLQKLVNGVSTSLVGPQGGGVSVGDVIRIETEGFIIRCKVNGGTVIQYVDPTPIISGAPGIGTFFTNPAFELDDWSGGDLLASIDPWVAQRSSPQQSKLYLVIQQSQYSTDGSTWTGYEWSCRINGALTDDPEEALTVDAGGAAWNLLDGQTVLIGSAFGEWDSAVCYVRGDQTVGPATTTLNISTSSEIRGHVSDDDYVVVLDEFRFRQRYGRIEVVNEEIVWYKDYDIEWSDLGANDPARRLAMMPPVPNMQTHAVKFVEIGSNSASFHWDWSDSYATAPAEAIDTWVSAGREDLAGNAWNSAAEEPGWKMVNAISGLRGLRNVLEVDDGNGNATTLPYRRGIRYAFTLRRPGETQAGDPPNSEPIVDFSVEAPSATFDQGFWRTSITVFEDEADKYNIMPEALVILFTEDRFTDTDGDPFNGSVGPIEDRENILLTGRILGDTIRKNPETGDVTFDVASPGAEASLYHNYPVVIQNDDAGETWIDTPDLTVDRAVHYYTTWHTNLNQIADLFQTGSTIEIYAQDFLSGDIYSTLNQFLWDRLFARLLCDKFGRFHAEIDAQNQPFGTVDTLFTLASGDWLDEVNVRQNIQTPVNAVDAGGLIYTAGNDPPVTPKLSRAPGIYDKYRGSRQASTALAITAQGALNTSCGRHLEGLNHEFEADLRLAGNWRYVDIAPQEAVDMNSLVTDRATLTGDYIIRAVTNGYDPEAGAIFTDIQVEQEADDGVAGVTIPIPDEMPDPDYDPGNPPGFGGEVIPTGELPGEPPVGTVQFYTTRLLDADDYWTDDITGNPPVWNLLNHDNQKSKCTIMPSATTDRFFGYGWGIWEYAPLPFDTGAWAATQTELQLATLFGHAADYNECYVFKMQFSNRPEQEEWGWAGVWLWWTDGGGDEHIMVGCLYTRDAWDNVVYITEIADWEEGVDFTADTSICREGGLALDMHSNTCYIVVSKGPEDDGIGNPTFGGWWKLYRSQDFGYSFALGQEETFTWGVEGYDVDLSDHYADVWVPWRNNTYNGGAVFWTSTCLQEADVAFPHDFVPLIYRSLNHGLSYSDIGDDGGDLDHGLNILGGPWNSLHRVYGVLATQNGAAGDNRTVYTWEVNAGWTEFRHVGAGGADDSRAWVVIEQDGYELETGLGMIEPYWLTDSSETDKQRPNDDTFWITWVP
jgi:hypothetical protein